MDESVYSTKIGRAQVYVENDGLRFEYDSGLTDKIGFPEEDSEVEAFINQLSGALDGKAEEWMR